MSSHTQEMYTLQILEKMLHIIYLDMYVRAASQLCVLTILDNIEFIELITNKSWKLERHCISHPNTHIVTHEQWQHAEEETLPSGWE